MRVTADWVDKTSNVDQQTEGTGARSLVDNFTLEAQNSGSSLVADPNLENHNPIDVENDTHNLELSTQNITLDHSRFVFGREQCYYNCGGASHWHVPYS